MSFIHRDLEEIREISKTNDPQFSSLLFEREHINQLLDAYASSLVYLDEKMNKTRHCITDKTSERLYGVDGKLHYTNQHFTVVNNLLNVLFTANNKIWISYNSNDPVWSGERDKSIKSIRRNIVIDLLPRLVKVIENCQDSKLKADEA